jgi:hypothetical protein
MPLEQLKGAKDKRVLLAIPGKLFLQAKFKYLAKGNMFAKIVKFLKYHKKKSIIYCQV